VQGHLGGGEPVQSLSAVKRGLLALTCDSATLADENGSTGGESSGRTPTIEAGVAAGGDRRREAVS